MSSADHPRDENQPPPAHGNRSISEAVPPPANPENEQTTERAAPPDNTVTHRHVDSAVVGQPPEPATGDQQPSTFGDYELVEEIARGGMGVVYKARQRTLNRVVALKMILTGQLAGEEEIQRFRAEAEAAAGLDHPGIVPIYEVGEHDGKHFFSMGFVEGRSLAQRIAVAPLAAREAAGLLEKIADAVEYAHQQGIIHRDLKPANVLLQSAPSGSAKSTVAGRETRTAGTSGGSTTSDPPAPDYAPKISDFGLAKRLESDSNLTASGQVLGTPSYMPPEQAAGWTDRIDARSDVYSLGAILYCMITGRAPFAAANVVETLRQVIDREPLAPRQINPTIDRDLETMCLKCLEKQPAKRYASAGDLADDLRRYLQGQPILARPISNVERALKWTRRKPLAASLIGLSVTAVIAFVTVILVYNSQLQAKNELLATAVASEATQKSIAQQQAELADKQTKLAYNALGSVLHEIQSGLKFVPGAQRSRRQMLATTIAGLREIADSLDGAPVADESLLIAHLQLGALILETGDAESNAATTLAADQFRKAVQIGDRLRRNQPDSAAHLINHLHGLRRLGQANLRLGKVDAARKHLDRAIAIAGRYPAQDDRIFLLHLTSIYQYLGEAKQRQGDTPGAKADYSRILDLMRQVYRDRPAGDPEACQNLAVAYERVAHVAIMQGNVGLADMMLAEAVDRAKQLVDSNPENYETQKNYVNILSQIADVRLMQNQAENARRLHQQALAICLGFVERDERNSAMQHMASKCHTSIGNVSVEMGDLGTAKAAFDEAESILQRLVAADPSRIRYQSDFASARFDHGRLLEIEGDLDGARAAYQDSLAQRQAIIKRSPDDVSERVFLSAIYSRLGDLNLKQRDLASARDAYRQSLDLRYDLVQADPTVSCNNRNLSVAYNKFVFLNVQMGRLDAAREAVRKGLEIAAGLAEANPTDIQVQRDLSISYEYQGNVEMSAGDLDAASRAYAGMVAIREQIANAAPEDAQAQRDLSVAVVNLGLLYLELKQLDKADAAFQRNLELKQVLLEKDETNAEARQQVALAYERMGDVRQQQRRHQEAFEFFNRRYEIAADLAKQSTTNRVAQVELAKAAWKLASGHLELDQIDPADRLLEQALEVANQQAAADPANINHQLLQADIHERQADSHRRAGDQAAALEALRTGLAIRRKLSEAMPNHPRLQSQLQACQEKLKAWSEDPVGK